MILGQKRGGYRCWFWIRCFMAVLYDAGFLSGFSSVSCFLSASSSVSVSGDTLIFV